MCSKAAVLKNGAWLNYHHLYYFWIIARVGGVARAAKKLGLGQPTLSTQLKSLEDAIGVPLFEREKKRLVLTDKGQLAFDYASEIFGLGEEMVDALADRERPGEIRLQIGAFDSVPKRVLFALIEKATAIEPCFVSLEEGPADSLIEALREHRLDLIVTNSPTPIAPRSVCRSRLLGEVPIVITGHPKHAGLKRGFPGSLANQPIVLPSPHSPARAGIERYFEQEGIALRAAGECQDPEVQRLIALSGASLAAANLAAFADSERTGDLVRIGELKGVREQIWMSIAVRKRAHPVAEALMKEFTAPVFA